MPTILSRPQAQVCRMDIQDLQLRLRRFSADRDWLRFHSPKNLAMALSVEAAELLEHFQWLTESESASLDSAKRERVAAEIADVQIYLAMLADKLGVDIEGAVAVKLEANAAKYPPGKGSGGTSGQSD